MSGSFFACLLRVLASPLRDERLDHAVQYRKATCSSDLCLDAGDTNAPPCETNAVLPA